MDLRVLRYYLAICREGNMSRAAEVLHVTQPTLSRQIADLERELGCTLLERGSRSVTPTEKGLYLRRRAEEIVSLADQTASELAHGDDVLEGDVHIGAGESEGLRVIAAKARSLQERYPHVRFHLRSGNSIDVIEWLERGIVDFAVLMSYPDINRFEHIRLAPTDAWGVFMREGDSLAAKKFAGPADLAGVPLIVSSQALEARDLSHWFGVPKDNLNVVATYNLVLNAVQFVREGVGYALGLDGLVSAGPGTGLEFRLLYPPVVSVIDFAWKSRKTLSAAAQAFLKEMQSDDSAGSGTGGGAAGEPEPSAPQEDPNASS